LYSSPNLAQFGQRFNLLPSTSIGFVMGTSFPHISQIIDYVIDVADIKLMVDAGKIINIWNACDLIVVA